MVASDAGWFGAGLKAQNNDWSEALLGQPAPVRTEARRKAPRPATALEDELVLGESIGHVRGLIELAAASRCPVLITGETGVGKNRIARAIHERGEQAEATYLTTNCAALPEHLVEAELFGYEKGAFTGASASKKGIFELADGGTLVLDELGEVPQHIQSKLLGVLDDGQVRRLGGEAVRWVDTRVIACTCADLEQRLGKSFRYDLYYRLSVIHIELPALRQRRQEIPALCRAIIRRLNHGVDALVSESELATLASYDWPGNIRELKNVLERALISARGGQLQPSRFLGMQTAADRTPSGGVPAVGTLEEMEREHIRRALIQYAGNLTQTARALGVSISTLKRKRKIYALA